LQTDINTIDIQLHFLEGQLHSTALSAGVESLTASADQLATNSAQMSRALAFLYGQLGGQSLSLQGTAHAQVSDALDLSIADGLNTSVDLLANQLVSLNGRVG